MIGNDLLLDRIMKAHHERLLAEARTRREAADARRDGIAPLRALAGRSGDALVTLGERLQAVRPHPSRCTGPEGAHGPARGVTHAHLVGRPYDRGS